MPPTEIIDLGSTESDASIDSAEEKSLTNMDVKAQLNLALEGLECEPGDVYGIGLPERFIDPEIHVNGHRIDFPLSAEDVRRCIQAGHPAPFGKKDATIVDSSGVHWGGIVKQVAKDMALNPKRPGFHAELYKMLLYERGAMFKAHQDTEKVPGMFATLVVQLPSPHTGASVRMRRDGFRDGYLDTSLTEYSYVWWYSDMSHEILPVESGIRWVLTFNLVRDDPDTPLREFIPDTTNLQRVLKGYYHQRINKEAGLSSNLLVMLQHEYTEANLKLALLKDQDLEYVLALERACEETNCHVFLGTLEHRRWGPTGEYDYDDNPGGMHSIEEILEEETYLTAVFDLRGLRLLDKKKVENEDFLEDDPFDGYDQDSEDYEGYQGNWGCEATHWYRKAVAILVPDTDVLEFLGMAGNRPSNCKPTKRKFLYLLHRVQQTDKSRSAYHDTLFKLCRRMVEHNESERAKNTAVDTGDFSSSLLADVIYVSFIMNKNDLALRALNAFPKWDDRALAILGTRIQKKGFSFCQSIVQSHFAKETWLGPLSRSLNILLAGCANGDTAQQILEKGRRSDLLGWVVATLTPSFLNYVHRYMEDADETVKFYSMLEAEDADGAKRRMIYNMLSHKVTRTFFLVALSQGKDLALFLDHCHTLGYRTLTENIIRSASLQAHKFMAGELKLVFIPCLQSLVLYISKWDIPYTTEPYQTFAASIISNFISKYLGPRPAEGVGWARNTLDCSCRICTPINRFLQNACLETGRFTGAVRERHHMHREIEDAVVRYTHQTDRSGFGNTLVVRKMKVSGQEKHELWEAKRREVKAILASFHPRTLERLMGERYEEFVKARLVRRAEGTGPLVEAETSRVNLHGGRGGMMAQTGVKRKIGEVEVIDLT
ncbi:uncharacterized protein EI97DRAFT_500363 [Westerdykella ornata]|uniref:Uncharacterized protein n=1 Tax=Westerdykella ornata TaxID=318751 RepID=A0A6A6JLK8_WESOR|nr:uncharacterized protein EI97DRAFT_500363 [Westerdykella ornata]KAF2277392.1 hypothetical protein EI97DRAFT_500363 [Westerdykella ornata]